MTFHPPLFRFVTLGILLGVAAASPSRADETAVTILSSPPYSGGAADRVCSAGNSRQPPSWKFKAWAFTMGLSHCEAMGFSNRIPWEFGMVPSPRA